MEFFPEALPFMLLIPVDISWLCFLFLFLPQSGGRVCLVLPQCLAHSKLAAQAYWIIERSCYTEEALVNFIRHELGRAFWRR